MYVVQVYFDWEKTLNLQHIYPDLQHICCSYRGYYMAARRYEISLWVLKNISRVRAVNEWNIFFNMRREILYLQAMM